MSRFRKKAIHVSRLDPFQTHYQLITLVVGDPFQGKISLLVLQLTINNYKLQLHKGPKRDTWMAFFRKRDTRKTENIDVKTWSVVQRDPWKIIILYVNVWSVVQRDPWKFIILYVNAWKSNLLLSVKTNQNPYSDASLRQNLICDSTFLLLHPIFRRLLMLDSLTN